MEIENIKKEIIEKEISASQIQSTRILPNILRNNNSKMLKNHKEDILDNLDTSVTSNEENINTFFDLNIKLSNIYLEKQDQCKDKITLLKSPHQRKQIHDPLNIRCDLPNWNISENNLKYNENKQVLKRDGQLEMPLRLKTSAKKLRYDQKYERNTCKYLLNEQSRSLIRKSNSKIKQLNEKPSDGQEITNTSNVDIKDNVDIPDINKIIDTEVLFTQAQSVTGYNTPNAMNTANNDGIKFDESSDNSYLDAESYNLDTGFHINYDAAFLNEPTESITMHKTVQNNVPTYELPHETMMDDSSQEILIDRNNSSNVLIASNTLYSCTCGNCTSYDEDDILYEDPVSDSTSNNGETEFFNELYANHYSDILSDDNWLEQLYFEEIQGLNVIKRNTCFDNNNTTENNLNILSVKQNESENLQIHKYIDQVQITNVKSYSEELGINSDSSIQSSKYENEKNLNEINNSNLESITENDIASQNKLFNQSTNLINISESKYQTPKNNRDLYSTHNQYAHCKICEQRYTCNICNKAYRYKSSLVQHLRKIHHILYGGYDKFYICKKCSKLYIRLRSFQKHIRLHDKV